MENKCVNCNKDYKYLIRDHCNDCYKVKYLRIMCIRCNNEISFYDYIQYNYIEYLRIQMIFLMNNTQPSICQNCYIKKNHL